MLVRLVAGLFALVMLSACAAQSVWAPDDAVQAARYVHPGPKEIALLTSISDRSGNGAHSALIINGSERILFDPAGNWDDPRAPERNDVRFGFTPQMEVNYYAYQSFGPFHAIVQRVTVSPEVAERALMLAKANGAVPSAFCTSATSGLLQQLPGFESLPDTMYPKTLMDAFAAVPGVRTELKIGPAAPDEAKMEPRLSPVIARVLAGQGGS